MFSAENRRHMALVRSLRGTPGHAAAKELLRELRRERAYRKRIERLRDYLSRALYRAARTRDALLARRP